MSNVCPYPGLRPFNEHESIFFKGRDEHIRQIIAQLARNKFIMVTGASGDGKSSLIYAGVIPNAKAGFFKAKHNSWVVADFRPERNPVKNMAHTLAKQLGCTSETEVEKQLGYGFSSLINLYKDSPYYLDTNEEKFQKLELAEQKQLKRKAANLLILVDQFEEFFTNAENYSNNQPSVEAHTAVNLLIETSKIALANDIPVYVVCTMRSDYIGQCAAFRGLPELIGFSQFFVPRLKRKEIQQVIVEPAILSGNKISNRLTQTLINELGDGLDQLPVLQHALNQVWKAADNGNQEMDLIHLVKIAGLSGGYLSDKDQADFEQWFKDVPEFKRKFFQSPSLENVLNAHANELFETAHLHYNKTHLNTVTRETAQLIIKKAFQSLTKTDGGRTVRSRMTLQEITNVIDRKEITPEIVGGILDIFRLPGNTFLRPFIESDAEYKALKNNDILDITHESLIRNWQLLADWTHEEDQNILTFRDFEKNMQRWVDSGKSSDYLLPIGPLTYFESWFLKLNPNKYWLRKYDESDAPETQKLLTAETIINHCREFIKRSARKLFVTRTVMKYGAAKIAASFGALVLVCLGIYLLYDYRAQLNETEFPKIEKRCFAYLDSRNVKNNLKADFLVNEEILNPGSMQTNLQKLSNDTLTIDVSIAIVEKLLTNNGGYNYNPLPDFASTSISVLCKTADKYINNITGTASETEVARIARILDVLNFLSIRQPALYTNVAAKPTAEKSADFLYNKYVSRVLADSAYKNFNGVILWNSLRLYMLQNKSDTGVFRKMIKAISPFESVEGRERFTKLFPKNANIKLASWNGNDYSYRGGYLVLSALYSGVSDAGNVSRCIDSLNAQNSKYKDKYLGGFYEIASFYLNFNQFNEAEFDKLLTGFAKVSSLEKTVIANKIIGQIPNYRWVEFTKDGLSFEPKYLLPKSNFSGFWDYYYRLLTGNTISEYAKGFGPANNEKLFTVAYYYKLRGITTGTTYLDSAEAVINFYKFSSAFSKISPSFLSTDRAYKVSGAVYTEKNSYLLLYPSDIIAYFTIDAWDPSAIGLTYGAALFDLFIIHEGTDKFYKPENNQLLLKQLYGFYPTRDIDECETIKATDTQTKFYNEFADSVAAFALKTSNTELQDEGLVQLVSIEQKFKTGNNATALAKIDKWGMDKMLNCFKTNQTDFKSNSLKHLIGNFARYMAINDRSKESFEIISTFNEAYEKRNALIANSLAVIYSGNDNSSLYLDSAIALIKDDDQFGLIILKGLGRTGDEKKAIDFMGRLNEKRKNDGLTNYITGVAESDKYYKASYTIPQFLTHDREFKILNAMVGTYIRHRMLTKAMDSKYVSRVVVIDDNIAQQKDWQTNFPDIDDLNFTFN